VQRRYSLAAKACARILKRIGARLPKEAEAGAERAGTTEAGAPQFGANTINRHPELKVLLMGIPLVPYK
jgi:hypothetical protein